MVQSEVWRGGWETRYELKESNLKTFIEVVTDGGGESMSVVMNGRGESMSVVMNRRRERERACQWL